MYSVRSAYRAPFLSPVCLNLSAGYLRSVGINTAVSTVDSWVHVRDNPALCGGSFAAANAQYVSATKLTFQSLNAYNFSVFFDGGRTPTQSGDFIFNVVVPALKKACPGKKIYITEYVLSHIPLTSKLMRFIQDWLDRTWTS